MHRFSLLVSCFVLWAILLDTTPVSAQIYTTPSTNVEIGVVTQAVFMERAPRGTGVSGHANWWAMPHWGLRGELRRDAAVNRDILSAFSDGSVSWGDQRRLSGTVSLLWAPVVMQDETVRQSLQLHVGPTLQRQRGEQMRFLGPVADGAEAFAIIRETGADNAYLKDEPSGDGTVLLLSDDTDGINWGATLGLSYGIGFGPADLRLVFTSRKVTDVDGVTFGIGGGLSLAF